MTTKQQHTPGPWFGPSKYSDWTISAPYQSRITGPFEASVYLDPQDSVRVAGKTGSECHARAIQHIIAMLASAERDALRAENEILKAEGQRLREALHRAESWLTSTCSHSKDGKLSDRREDFPIEWRIIDQARAALAGGGK